jgi:hypothetical protein
MLCLLGMIAAEAPAASASPGKKTAPAAEKAKAKEEEMGKVEGIEVKRGDGYFGVQLVDGNFKITFYDAKKQVITAPIHRAALRWPVNYRPADERTVLNVSGDVKSLTSAKVVKPPYLFKLFITFLADGADEAGPGTESFTIDFRT